MRRGFFMQSIITLSDVSFELENGRTLFQNISFSLEPKLTALVGPNGIGKTTLVKIIAGEYEATRGVVRCNTPISFIPQKESAPMIPVYEYLASNYSWSILGEKLLEGIDREAICSELSGGQWMRVRLANKIDEQFLILDEPTNDLDREGREALFNFLEDYTFGALIISHDRECLDLCDDILELSNQGLTKYGGGWENYEELKEDERERLAGNLDRAKRERKASEAEKKIQEERQNRRNKKGAEAAAKGGMPKILLGRRKQNAEATTGKVNSLTTEKINEKVREAHNAFNELKTDPVMYADLVGHGIPNQKLVAEGKGFNIKFTDWLYTEDLDFSFRGNIRVAFKGRNGSGKSSLIKAILGEKFETRGELRVGELKTLYLDQRCSVLDEEEDIFSNLRKSTSLGDIEIRNGLARFLFFGDSVFQKVKSLSGGERLRVALALGFLGEEKPELLILDEPTNNLDLGNIKFLENLVAEFKGALIIISHDEVFLEKAGVIDSLELF